MTKSCSLNPFLGDRWQYVDKKMSWQQAIVKVCNPLLNNKAITPNYINAIIKCVTETGPYFILSDGFAMPHARPEDGVTTTETQLSLLKCQLPVRFPNGKEVSLFIALAACNSENHLNAITTLLEWLDQDNRLHNLLLATSKAELIKFL